MMDDDVTSQFCEAKRNTLGRFAPLLFLRVQEDGFFRRCNYIDRTKQ